MEYDWAAKHIPGREPINARRDRSKNKNPNSRNETPKSKEEATATAATSMQWVYLFFLIDKTFKKKEGEEEKCDDCVFLFLFL
jgi:hypothetical protein